jgi:non-specific serine/threonine protein kinase
MGLGKTIQLLALMVHERESSPGTKLAAPAAPTAPPKRGRPSKADLAAREAAKSAAIAAPAKVVAVKRRATLLICPTSLVGNWQREAARFAPSLKVVIHHGPQRRADIADQVNSADLVITTYGTVARDYHAMSSVTWGRVVLDEAQNIKNSDTQQTKAVRGLSADRRVALTGTPIENRLSELWSLFEFLNPGLLGSADRFQKRFTLPIERDGDVDRAQLLRNITGPFLLRRLKTDKSILAELPEKIEVEVPCQLTREQGALYQAVVDDLLGKLNDGTEDSDAQKKGHVLAAMTRLKQVCDHPALLLGDRSAMAGRSGKLNRIEELLEEVLAAGEKALLFTQFAELGHQLKTHLQERFQREVLFLHGGTSRQARDTMVARFSEDSGPPIFLLSLRAGGTGLNLVAANHVIHVDRWWNPAVEDQASDRAFRIGQTKNVQVRKMVCMGTLEEKIAAMLADKRKLAASVVGTGESWLADLSLKAIRDLVALNARDAIED